MDFLKRLLFGIALVFSVQALRSEEAPSPEGSPGELVHVAVTPNMYELVNDAAKAVLAKTNVGARLQKANAPSVMLAVSQGLVELGFATRTATAQERGAHPEVDLRTIHIGDQVVVLAVSKDVWEGGIKALNAGDARRIYEKRVTNWKELGGPDLKIAFFTSNEGRGVWELFAEWLYQNTQRAPLGRFPVMKTHEEARDAIEFSPGAITLISPAYVTPPASNALGLKLENGEVVQPTPENVISGKYPMKRSMYLVVNERPAGDARKLADFFWTGDGRKLLESHGCVPAKPDDKNP